jgi:hypothetical protein
MAFQHGSVRQAWLMLDLNFLSASGKTSVQIRFMNDPRNMRREWQFPKGR